MFNLLPKADKKAIRREYRTRLAAVALWFSFATFMIASLLLIPSLFLSSKKEEIAERRFESLSKSVSAEESIRLDGILRSAENKVKQFHTAETSKYFHELFIQIASFASPRLSLTSLSAVQSDGGGYRVDIGGNARDRGTLVSFQKALEKSSMFKSVTLPISNLAKDIDIDFSINATGAK